ncbi:Crp/Fnr family transcriptional regulator [Sporolactobacillus shoreicorticis]|uniref:Crp/Fnr family transcriptional regulator n=1 Tax=Sporolactobacillus shoreicorticis TaxID=1923877 RepID=A0ABW5S2X1_9BACL|nr:Crp/Fnr family transcriptional regulator [Sporolactobacillus shoreicorticis]MCO7125255.1 Crp/Fnr family transcriptional regulator [Sporolactobacillus shoreicorticis]
MKPVFKNQLTEKIYSYIDASDKELNSFIQLLKPISIQKGDFFIRSGDTKPWFGLIISGLFRGFYIKESGEEFTKHFFRENDFMSAHSRSLVDIDYLPEASEYYFQALEDSIVLKVDDIKEAKRLLMHPCWVEMFSKEIERIHKIEEGRIQSLMLDDATQRYLRFKQNFPGLENRIKQLQIASYIGISPVSLSRIRAKLKSLNIG